MTRLRVLIALVACAAVALAVPADGLAKKRHHRHHHHSQQQQGYLVKKKKHSTTVTAASSSNSKAPTRECARGRRA